MSKIIALLAVAIFTLVPTGRAEELVIQLLGDSTVQGYAQANPKRGWGMYLGQHFDENVKIVNRAVLGKSSKSYQTSSQWANVNNEKADYWFIQFGHNDSNRGAERHTDPAVEFPKNLRILIAAARKAGAKPVLVTPPPRRRYQEDGRLTRDLELYVEAIKRVGTEDSVPVLDLNAHAKVLFLELGDEASTDLNAPGDRTHFSEKGARMMAQYVAEEVRITIPELSAHLISTKQTQP